MRTDGRHAASDLRTPSSTLRLSSDRIAQATEPVDLELDLVAGVEPGVDRLTELEQAAAADGAGADHVAGEELDVLRGALDHLGEGAVDRRRRCRA